MCGVFSIPSPVWRCLREELEWWLVDILQATTQLSWRRGVRALTSLCWGEVGGGGRGGGVMLKSLPGNASTSTIEQGKTAHNEGKIRWRENIFIFSPGTSTCCLAGFTVGWSSLLDNVFFFNSFLIENI